MTADDPAAVALRRRLGVGKPRWPRRFVKLALLLGLVAGGVLLWQRVQAPEPPPAWRTAPVDRGEIATRVSATGTLAPLRVVEVGPEISGRITEVLVAENDRVTAGQVLARFDETPIRARLEAALAQLEVSLAREAEVSASLRQAKTAERRSKRLREGGVNAEREAEASEADLGRARAQLTQAAAQTRAAKAQVSLVEAELARATLASPIDGVVLTRAVEPGKAVAASLQTPVLFTIAADLRHMELQLAIDEADVALVKPGLTAGFTVDAWAEQPFPATVIKVHMSPTVAQNLVTYRALLAVDNAELKLLPGMTATATITAATVKGALRVPNVALRFAPPRTPGAGGGGAAGPLFPGMRGGGPSGGGPDETGPRVHVLRDGAPVRVPVRTGATDGQFTEVTGGALQEGDPVILGVEAPRSFEGVRKDTPGLRPRGAPAAGGPP